jgi:hypothetical protein
MLLDEDAEAVRGDHATGGWPLRRRETVLRLQSPAEVPGNGSYSGLAATAWEAGAGVSAKKTL